MGQHIIDPYTGAWGSVEVPVTSCMLFAKKLWCIPSVPLWLSLGRARIRAGIRPWPCPIQPCRLTARLEAGVLRPKAEADHMENQEEEEIVLMQWRSLLSFWGTEHSWCSFSNKKQCRDVFLPSKWQEGLRPSFPIQHSFWNLMMIAWGEGCVLVLKHLLEEPVNLSSMLRMPGEVCLTILEPACVNTLCSTFSIVACFSSGHFSRHT